MATEAYSLIHGYEVNCQYRTSNTSWQTFKVTKERITYVLKRIPHSDLAERLVRQLKTVTPHALIVQLREHLNFDNNHYLVFEYCNESFEEFLVNAKDRFQNERMRRFDLEKYIFPWVTQVCFGLVHLHEHGIVHNDLKPSNIFFCNLPNGDMRVKISDYQAWNMVSSDGSLVNHTQNPTSCYNAPETWPLNENDTTYYRSNIDVWSLGCFAVELLNWKPLFTFAVEEIDKSILRAKLLELRQRNFIHIPSDCRENFAQLIRKMLRLDPELRPDSHEVLQDLVMSGGQRTQRLVQKYSHEEEIFYTPSINTAEMDGSNPVLEPDLYGVYPPVDWSRDLSVWKKIASGKAGQLIFPPMRILHTDKILEMMLVRRKRSTAPNSWSARTPDLEASDVPSSTSDVTPEYAAKELRIWARLRVEGPESEDLHISIKLILPSVVDLILRAYLNLRKTRRLNVDKEFKNVLLHFQPTGMTLLPSESPKAIVRVDRVLHEERNLTVPDDLSN